MAYYGIESLYDFRGTVKSELKAANQQQALGIAILLLVLIISPIIIFLVRNATATIHIFSLTLSTKEQVGIFCNHWYRDIYTSYILSGIDTRKTKDGRFVVFNITISCRTVHLTKPFYTVSQKNGAMLLRIVQTWHHFFGDTL